jgi:hypothetical protein
MGTDELQSARFIRVIRAFRGQKDRCAKFLMAKYVENHYDSPSAAQRACVRAAAGGRRRNSSFADPREIAKTRIPHTCPALKKKSPRLRLVFLYNGRIA